MASFYLEGCNFLTTVVSTLANSLTHSLLFLWGPEAQGDFTHWCTNLFQGVFEIALPFQADDIANPKSIIMSRVC